MEKKRSWALEVYAKFNEDGLVGLFTLSRDSGSVQLTDITDQVRYLLQPSSLQQRLDACDFTQPMTAEERAWIDAAPVGKEEI